MDIRIHHDFALVRVDDLKRIYESVGWTPRDERTIVSVFTASTHASFAVDGDRTVACGRALSDGVFNAAIYDVVVHSHYQGTGVGQLIVESLLNKLGGVSCIHLIANTGTEGFYQQLGFKKAKTAMARYLNLDRGAEYLEE